ASDRGVPTAGGQDPAVRREGERMEVSGVSLEDPQQLPGGNAPELAEAVHSARRQELAIWGEGKRSERYLPTQAVCSGPLERVPPPVRGRKDATAEQGRSEEHTSELQSRRDLVCRLLLEKKKEQSLTREYLL